MTQSAAGLSILSNNVRIADGPNLDAFSRLRVSDPTTLFSSQCQYDTDPLIFETGATGTGVAGAHDANTRMVALACGAGAGTSFIQSYEYIPYQAGKSQLIFMTGLFDTAVAGATVDVGLFDSSNGLFFRQNGASGLEIVRRTSTSGVPVDNVVPQASWNLDRLDGAGASGVTLDVTKVFILIIDAQFLGMGRIRLGFDIGGLLIYVHEFLNANILAVPYVQSLALPAQMLVTSSAGAKTAYFKCVSVSSEGGLSADLQYEFASPEQTVTAGNDTATHILSLRPRTTFNSIINRVRVGITSVDIIVTGNNDIQWQLCVGSTFSVAPAFTDVNTTYSATQYSSTVGTLSGVGLVIASGYIPSGASVKGTISQKSSFRYPITLDRAGNVRALGTVSLIVTGIGAPSATRAILNYAEVR